MVKHYKWFFYPIIVVAILAIVIGIVSGGMNIGIDFSGGSIITVNMNGDFNADELRDIVKSAEGIKGEVTVGKTTDTSSQQAIIRTQVEGDESVTTTLVNNVMAKVNEKYPQAVFGGVDSVGGVASGDLVRSAVFSVILASILMLIYIWVRFDLYSGIGAVAALLHDVIFMICVMCIFQVQVDSTFIAACLTIVGYSINNTVIVFDRIRENSSQMNPREFTKEQITDVSIRQTLGRTINTSITTLIMITCLYIVGVQSVKIFAFPIIIGLLAGTFSSLFIAGPVWMKLAEKFGKNKKRKGVKAIS